MPQQRPATRPESPRVLVESWRPTVHALASAKTSLDVRVGLEDGGTAYHFDKRRVKPPSHSWGHNDGAQLFAFRHTKGSKIGEAFPTFAFPKSGGSEDNDEDDDEASLYHLYHHSRATAEIYDSGDWPAHPDVPAWCADEAFVAELARMEPAPAPPIDSNRLSLVATMCPQIPSELPHLVASSPGSKGLPFGELPKPSMVLFVRPKPPASAAETAAALYAERVKSEAAAKAAGLWRLEDSIFKLRVRETDSRAFFNDTSTHGKMLEHDWRLMTKCAHFKAFLCEVAERAPAMSTVSVHERRPQQILQTHAECREGLQLVFRLLCQTLEFYGASEIEQEDSFVLGKRAFAQFCADAKLAGPEHAHMVFTAVASSNATTVVSSSSSKGDASPNSTLNTLNRRGLLEAVVRVMHFKGLLRWNHHRQEEDEEDAAKLTTYDARTGHHVHIAAPPRPRPAPAPPRDDSVSPSQSQAHTPSLVSAFQRLVSEHLALLPAAAIVDSDEWRCSTLYKASVDAELRPYKKVLYSLYMVLAELHPQLGRARHFSVEAWRAFAKDAGLLSAIPAKARLEANRAFVLARMRFVDESTRRFKSLSWVSFLEALCRLVAIFPAPSLNSMAQLRARELTEFYEKVESYESQADELKWLLTPDYYEVKRLLTPDPGQSLPQKLKFLLPYVLQNLAVTHAGIIERDNVAVDLDAFLTPHQRQRWYHRTVHGLKHEHNITSRANVEHFLFDKHPTMSRRFSGDGMYTHSPRRRAELGEARPVAPRVTAA